MKIAAAVFLGQVELACVVPGMSYVVVGFHVVWGLQVYYFVFLFVNISGLLAFVRRTYPRFFGGSSPIVSYLLYPVRRQATTYIVVYSAYCSTMYYRISV